MFYVLCLGWSVALYMWIVMVLSTRTRMKDYVFTISVTNYYNTTIINYTQPWNITKDGEMCSEIADLHSIERLVRGPTLNRTISSGSYTQ